MSATVPAIEIESYLQQHQEKELLRFVTVGSVDDGKSTLIGRLLHDTNGVYEDQLAAVRRASTKGTQEIDFSLFTDGLKAEREQGITIDVAYRYCSTEKRKFIIADTPGHVQYTRNMATGASTANVALILVDARLGVLPQSRRHAFIASLLGIRHLCVCINKMDLVAYDEARFREIVTEFSEFLAPLTFSDVTFLPVSAKVGDNIVERSAHTTWYEGPTVLQYLEEVPISSDDNLTTLRFPVQLVLRPDLNYRGFAGQVASGVVAVGDELMVLPSRKRSRVKSIDTFDGALAVARAPQSISLQLEDEVDISRGDVLVHPDDAPAATRHFSAHLVWLNERVLEPGRSYWIKQATRVTRVQVEAIDYVVDLEALQQRPAEQLGLNDIGRVRIRAQRELFLDPYQSNRATGAFVLIDPLTNDTLAAGMVEERLEGGAELAYSDEVTPAERKRRWGQRGAALTISAPDAAGATEAAVALERALFAEGAVVVRLPVDTKWATEDGWAKLLASRGVIALIPRVVPGAGLSLAIGDGATGEEALPIEAGRWPLLAEAAWRLLDRE